MRQLGGRASGGGFAGGKPAAGAARSGGGDAGAGGRPGPALDAAYVPTGRSAYVRAGDKAGTRYLIVDTGVRFAIPDDDAAHDLGLSEPTPAPWRILTRLPAGPELSRRGASIARDAVAASP